VVSWVRLKTPIDCILHSYWMYTMCFSTLGCCGWAYGYGYTLMPYYMCRWGLGWESRRHVGDMSARQPKVGTFGRQAPIEPTKIRSCHFFVCRGLPTVSKFALSTRGTYGVIIVQTGMYVLNNLFSQVTFLHPSHNIIMVTAQRTTRTSTT
jgi:hypothetical protein